MVWAEWVVRHPGKAVIKNGDMRPLSKFSSLSHGKRQPGKRGYLGRYDACRQFVLQVQAWADVESDQGHDLNRQHLLTEFQNRLTAAIADAHAQQADGTFLPDQARDLAAWETKLASLSCNKKSFETGSLSHQEHWLHRAVQAEDHLPVH